MEKPAMKVLLLERFRNFVKFSPHNCIIFDIVFLKIVGRRWVKIHKHAESVYLDYSNLETILKN